LREIPFEVARVSVALSTVISGVRIKDGATHNDVRVTSGGKLTLPGAKIGA
jgi:hypothetical protein